MNFELHRVAREKGYTIGRLFLLDDDGNQTRKICDTLEPQWRDYKNGEKKVKGKSAIPEGRYLMAVTYSPKFERWLPLLLHVPDFTAIRIHEGNTPQDTEGCILVGENWRKGEVLRSRQALKRLMQIVSNRPEGEAMHITVS